MGTTPASARNVPREVSADARLALATAVGCALSYVVFVALPLSVDGVAVPEVVHGLWAVGVAVAMYLSPVAAGLAAYASLAAVVTRGRTMAPSTRRLHLVTVGVVAAHLALCVATLGAAQLWLD